VKSTTLTLAPNLFACIEISSLCIKLDLMNSSTLVRRVESFRVNPGASLFASAYYLTFEHSQPSIPGKFNGSEEDAPYVAIRL
jgi:hypothetical protein